MSRSRFPSVMVDIRVLRFLGATFENRFEKFGKRKVVNTNLCRRCQSR